MEKPKLTDIKGVGKAAADRLAEAGFNTVDDIINADAKKLSAVSGFGATRAERTIAAAKALQHGDDAPATDSTPTAAPAKPAQTAAKPAPEAKPVATPKVEEKPKPKSTAPAAAAAAAAEPVPPAANANKPRFFKEPGYIAAAVLLALAAYGFAQQGPVRDYLGLDSLSDESTTATAMVAPNDTAKTATSPGGMSGAPAQMPTALPMQGAAPSASANANGNVGPAQHTPAPMPPHPQGPYQSRTDAYGYGNGYGNGYGRGAGNGDVSMDFAARGASRTYGNGYNGWNGYNGYAPYGYRPYGYAPYGYMPMRPMQPMQPAMPQAPAQPDN